MRSAELLKNTSADLLALVNSGEQVAKLAIDAHATAVVLEALLNVPGDKSAAFEALAQAALAPLADEQEKAGEHIVFNEIGAKFLQCLVLLNKPSGEGGESERCFAQVLLDKAGAKQLQAWALTSEPNERAVFLVRSLVIVRCRLLPCCPAALLTDGLACVGCEHQASGQDGAHARAQEAQGRRQGQRCRQAAPRQARRVGSPATRTNERTNHTAFPTDREARRTLRQF